MPLVDVKNVSKTFAEEAATATLALRNVSLAIESGEFVAIKGQSGSGKSTLLHILGLLSRPTSGTYSFDGHATTELTDAELAKMRNSTIGFVFQAFHLLSRATVLDNVLLPLTYSTVPPREHRPRALAALEQVELSHRLQHVSSQLSGGEKQRVAIARALVNQPKLVFADEPTGNLDSKTGHAVMELFDALHRQGKTIIMVTHETVTASYAHRVITLQDGQIISDEAQERAHTHYHK